VQTAERLFEPGHREYRQTDVATRRDGEKERAALFPSRQLAAGSKISISECFNDFNVSKDADILLPYSLTLIETCQLLPACCRLPYPHVSVSMNLHIHGDSETSQDFRIYPRLSLADEVARDAGAS
jgi:hypothetical protein